LFVETVQVGLGHGLEYIPDVLVSALVNVRYVMFSFLATFVIVVLHLGAVF